MNIYPNLSTSTRSHRDRTTRSASFRSRGSLMNRFEFIRRACCARTLLGRVSHDLRGPAGIVSGVLDELESRESDGTDASLFAMARRGLGGILRIAERLEMVAQLDAGPLRVERLPIDLSALCHARWRHEAKTIQKRKSIAISLDLPANARATVDQRWFGMAVMEIIANSDSSREVERARELDGRKRPAPYRHRRRRSRLHRRRARFVHRATLLAIRCTCRPRRLALHRWQCRARARRRNSFAPGERQRRSRRNHIFGSVRV